MAEEKHQAVQQEGLGQDNPGQCFARQTKGGLDENEI